MDMQTGLQERGRDYSFMTSLVQHMKMKERSELLEAMILPCFIKDSIALLQKEAVQREIDHGMFMMKLSIEDAGLLFYTGGYSERQIHRMAKIVNRLTDGFLC
jgi:hypothetical protein